MLMSPMTLSPGEATTNSVLTINSDDCATSIVDYGEVGSEIIFHDANFFSKKSSCCRNCKRSCIYCIPSLESGRSTSGSTSSCKSVATDTDDLLLGDSELTHLKRESVEFKIEKLDIDKCYNDDIKSPLSIHDLSSHFSSDSDSKTSDAEPAIEKSCVKKVLKIYTCRLCLKTFKTSRALKDHEPVHTGAKDHVCDLCGKAYSTRANLLLHKQTHDGKRTFSCCICEKSFLKKDTLQVHFRNHTGEKPFSCDQCPRSFIRKSTLRNHQVIHDDRKRFVCSVCGRTFSTTSGLKYHESSHNTDTNVKKSRKPSSPKSILCQLCGKIYSSMSNFRSHELVHQGQKPFKCHTCHRVYAKKDSLLIHQRTHTELRLYSCHICDYSAYRNGTLKSHILRHTGVRPYACPQCPQKFTQTSSLSYHMKSHEKQGPLQDLSNDCTKDANSSEPFIDVDGI